jgi:formate/nitrite transporter FocA (FNT family)
LKFSKGEKARRINLTPSFLKKMSWLDWLIVIAVGAHLGSLASTSFIVANLGLAKSTAIQLEGNPIARSLMDNSFWLLVTDSVLVGSFIGIYVWFRHEIDRMKAKNRDFRWMQLALYLFAFTVIYVCLQDFANDFPILLKLIMGGL